MYPKYILGAALCSLSLLSGCATIIDGSNQDLHFHSTPSEAEVKINGRAVGRTPVTVSRDRKRDDLRIEISKDGYQTHHGVLESDLNMVFLVNLVSGGAFGSTTDYATGAMWQYKPGSYRTELAPAEHEARREWRREMQVVELIMNHYPELQADLQAGQGPHLQATLAAIGEIDAETEIPVPQLEQWHRESEHPGEFADRFLAAIRT